MRDKNDREIPPYSDRKKSGNVRDKGSAVRDGAKVGGAHGPVENDEMSRPDAADTTGSQADEQPARQEARTRDHDEGVGPAHEPGARRGEQQRR